IEFGVAGGTGLRILEVEAARISRETGVAIDVVGFDSGAGLPETTGDYRDHPDIWRPGDYPMDLPRLQTLLAPSTQLILGPVRETVPRWVETQQAAPVGFVAFDLDLYSSTRDALQIFTCPGASLLRQIPCYFDDLEYFYGYHGAGEFLAISEFNTVHAGRLEIDPWQGVRDRQVFPAEPYLRKMYVAHDLAAISAAVLIRDIAELPVRV
ncbi:MAG: hypothetical protein A3K11_04790, partial [Nitrospirae bacterium RIFCSPLOWO2_12_FULL_63_8]